MNWRVFVLIAPLLLLLSCHKKNDSQAQNNTPFSYKLSYDSVISIYPNNTANFIFNISVLTGSIDTNAIHFSISGLPGNVSVTPSSLMVTNLLGGVFTLAAGDVSAGTYDLDFLAQDHTNGDKHSKLILKINAPIDYVPRLAGSYVNSSDYCQPFDTAINYYTSVVYAVADTPYEMKITNLKNFGTGFVVRAWVSNVITIPVQTVAGYTIWGSGNFTTDSRPAYDTMLQMTINDTMVNGLDTQRCLIHLQR